MCLFSLLQVISMTALCITTSSSWQGSRASPCWSSLLFLLSTTSRKPEQDISSSDALPHDPTLPHADKPAAHYHHHTCLFFFFFPQSNRSVLEDPVKSVLTNYPTAVWVTFFKRSHNCQNYTLIYVRFCF